MAGGTPPLTALPMHASPPPALRRPQDWKKPPGSFGVALQPPQDGSSWDKAALERDPLFNLVANTDKLAKTFSGPRTPTQTRLGCPRGAHPLVASLFERDVGGGWGWRGGVRARACAALQHAHCVRWGGAPRASAGAGAAPLGARAECAAGNVCMHAYGSSPARPPSCTSETLPQELDNITGPSLKMMMELQAKMGGKVRRGGAAPATRHPRRRAPLPSTF